MTGRRVRRPTLFSLWRKARRENSAASRLLGSTSLRFALHGWQRRPWAVWFALLRELTFVIDANGYAWAANMKRLLQETCAIVAKRQSKRLTGNEYKNLQKRYRNILTRGAKQLPPIPPRQNGKRGRVAKSDAHNLWERLKKHETAVLLFARLSYVPFTNNRAERDLRMSKVKQKVSGCFRTRKHAEAYCRISSYLQTMANQGYNPLVAIQMAFSGQLYADRGE